MLEISKKLFGFDRDYFLQLYHVIDVLKVAVIVVIYLQKCQTTDINIT